MDNNIQPFGRATEQNTSRQEISNNDQQHINDTKKGSLCSRILQTVTNTSAENKDLIQAFRDATNIHRDKNTARSTVAKYLINEPVSTSSECGLNRNTREVSSSKIRAVTDDANAIRSQIAKDVKGNPSVRKEQTSTWADKTIDDSPYATSLPEDTKISTKDAIDRT